MNRWAPFVSIAAGLVLLFLVPNLQPEPASPAVAVTFS